jgi:hypothetical protein
MNDSPVLEVLDLDFPWGGLDPFIFTVHHLDRYPAGNTDQGPAVPLTGRQIGMDFSYRDGWSMYHGDRVPGFPQHPHRGFETVTVVRRGYVDHSDSLGATARYGEGDVQWLTTGSGIQHAEMFPLIDPDGPNPLHLFQIWLNLPPHSKMVDAYFGMLWNEDIPTVVYEGATVDVIAGSLDGFTAPTPPPDSWASDPSSELAIWVIQIEPARSLTLPAQIDGLNRMLHCYEGSDVDIEGSAVGHDVGVRLRSDRSVTITNRGTERAEFLLLQGRPIGAPVIQVGPFVMNSADEIQTAMQDYRRTQFGAWPWSGPAPVHSRDEGRFALHADGKVEHRDRPRVS